MYSNKGDICKTNPKITPGI